MLFAGGDPSEFRQVGGGGSRLPGIITVWSCKMGSTTGFIAVWKVELGSCTVLLAEEKQKGFDHGVFLGKLHFKV